MNLKADVVIENARVFTSNKDMPQAEAVAVKGNRIIYVGTNDGVKGYKDRHTRVVDGQGHTLTPGFIDSHFHLLWGSIWSGAAQLYDAKDIHDVKTVLQDFAEKNKTAEWVDGRGIKYNIVQNRQQLDEIVPDRPVYINAYDGHTSWANTKALELAGILQPGKEAEGNGVIVRDENGLATGELRETAMGLVSGLIPEPGEARKRELLKMTMARINATGVTSVHNMNGDMEELMTYAAVEDAGEMTLRVYVPYHVKPETTEDMLGEAAEMAKVQGEFARGGAAKFFMDGVWESYTALNIEPYADDPEAKPDGIYSLEHFTRMAALCDKMGLQIFVHCCGDGAVRRTLDGYEAVQRSNGKRDSRHRIEHIEVIHPDDIPRFQQLGVLPSMQTSHAPFSIAEGDVWPARVGEGRWHLSFAWRDIKNAGNNIAFGSDWPVAPYDPMVNLHVGMNREKWNPGDPDQTLTLEELILGYTRDAAYAEFMENEKGQIKEGYLADLVLFSHDLFALPRQDILQAKAVMTMVNGRVVFEA
ncbi:MAG: amidohydrolase [Chloroflexi bacterium]|nr:amidohydrolase [Chloroflexota bacterium]MDL1944533.1 amidohydrolase [Chloroflexi bacterium CFX2]